MREAEGIDLSLVSQEVDTVDKDTSGEDEVFSEEDYWIDTSELVSSSPSRTQVLAPSIWYTQTCRRRLSQQGSQANSNVD